MHFLSLIMVVSFTLRSLYYRDPLNHRLGGTQIRSGDGWRKEKSLSLPGIEPRFSIP